MYSIHISNKFKRDIKRCDRQQKDMEKLKEIVELLETGTTLPYKNRDHGLIGNWDGHRECHIEPDWLLIYRVDDEEKAIELVRTGSHPELFG